MPRPANNNNASGESGQAAGGNSDGGRGGVSFPGVDNRSVEFFMEVTPENMGGGFADAGQANNGECLLFYWLFGLCRYLKLLFICMQMRVNLVRVTSATCI